MNSFHKPVLVFLLYAFPAFFAPAASAQVHFDVFCSMDWIRGTMSARTSYNLAQAGIRLPAGRYMGEEILEDSFSRLLRPYLFSIQVDSGSTIHSLTERRETSLEDLGSLLFAAEKIPPSLSEDLSAMNGRYTIPLEKISAFFTRHTRAVEPFHPLAPVQSQNYTGIIIIADEELPVHGRRATALAVPCLFPKIWDTDMKLVYERNMFEPKNEPGKKNLIVRYAVPGNIFRPTPSGLDGELAALAGPYPLRILAREIFGISPTDLVIDREDALKILSTENNRRLLREGRVILVLNEKELLYQLKMNN
jgi:hypothetical protein